MKQQFSNLGYGYLKYGIDSTQTQLTVENMQGVPELSAEEFFVATIYTADSFYGSNIEIVKITNVDGNLWSVERNWENSGAKSHLAGSRIELRLTAGSMAEIYQNTDNTYFKKSGGQVSGDLAVTGNLLVQGETVQVDKQITTGNTTVLLNDGETGPGVTAGFAGLEIDRGTEANYELGYDEASGLVEVGEVGDRQPLLTRERNPNERFLKWNPATNRAEAKDINWADVKFKPNLVEENDERLSNDREWSASTVSQAEAEAGNATTRTAWTSQRVRQAVLGWWDSSTEKTKLDDIEPAANNYQHPDTHPAEMIEQSEQRQFASQVEKDVWNAKETPEGAQQKVNQAKSNAVAMAIVFGA